MATILLNESDPQRHEHLRSALQQQGHRVWSAQHLNEIIATLHDVAVDLMILDLDHQRLEELAAFAERWRGVKILFQASSTALVQDFRTWMADRFVCKEEHNEKLARAISQLLQIKSLQRYAHKKRPRAKVGVRRASFSLPRLKPPRCQTKVWHSGFDASHD